MLAHQHSYCDIGASGGSDPEADGEAGTLASVSLSPPGHRRGGRGREAQCVQCVLTGPHHTAAPSRRRGSVEDGSAYHLCARWATTLPPFVPERVSSVM